MYHLATSWSFTKFFSSRNVSMAAHIFLDLEGSVYLWQIFKDDLLVVFQSYLKDEFTISFTKCYQRWKVVKMKILSGYFYKKKKKNVVTAGGAVCLHFKSNTKRKWCELWLANCRLTFPVSSSLLFKGWGVFEPVGLVLLNTNVINVWYVSTGSAAVSIYCSTMFNCDLGPALKTHGEFANKLWSVARFALYPQMLV